MFENLKKINFYNATVVFVTAFVLLALLFDTIFDLPKEISKLIKVADWTICIFFFYDFIQLLNRLKIKLNTYTPGVGLIY